MESTPYHYSISYRLSKTQYSCLESQYHPKPPAGLCVNIASYSSPFTDVYINNFMSRVLPKFPMDIAAIQVKCIIS